MYVVDKHKNSGEYAGYKPIGDSGLEPYLIYNMLLQVPSLLTYMRGSAVVYALKISLRYFFRPSVSLTSAPTKLSGRTTTTLSPPSGK